MSVAYLARIQANAPIEGESSREMRADIRSTSCHASGRNVPKWPMARWHGAYTTIHTNVTYFYDIIEAFVEM
jgi:hypothetical protein